MRVAIVPQPVDNIVDDSVSNVVLEAARNTTLALSRVTFLPTGLPVQMDARFKAPNHRLVRANGRHPERECLTTAHCGPGAREQFVSLRRGAFHEISQKQNVSP